ncbi:MAG TPA: hypothetical protein VFK05_08510 [Polyangiaceae bacterium]|nr:hypothetical protein [Polyangiaceae bacterium]
MSHASLPWSSPPRVAFGLLLLAALLLAPRAAHAGDARERLRPSAASADGVYGRFDGDLDLGLALGAEFGSAGNAAPALRASAHYFSIAGVYASGRIKAGEQSAPSLFGLGVDLRPLFVPRWVKGYQTGSALFDLTLDSLSLSLGAFWAGTAEHSPESSHGFDAQLGFGVPLLASAAGPWLEARGALRYPDGASREEAVFVSLSWHGFVTTPFSRGSGL